MVGEKLGEHLPRGAVAAVDCGPGQAQAEARVEGGERSTSGGGQHRCRRGHLGVQEPGGGAQRVDLVTCLDRGVEAARQFASREEGRTGVGELGEEGVGQLDLDAALGADRADEPGRSASSRSSTCVPSS